MVLSAAVLALPAEDFDLEAMEMSGESGLLFDAPRYDQKADPPRGQVLLIPDSGADVVAMFDPYDGTYWGDFIVDDSTGTYYNFATPINAMQIYGQYILVSDQVSDAVWGFDEYGNYLYTVADGTYLNNVRGIDFRDDTVFVTSGDDYVAMFDGPGSFVGYFIQDGTDPFDIMFVDEVESGSALYCDIQGTTDNVRHYYADGTLYQELFNTSFPEQVQVDILNTGYYLVASFSDNMIYQFTIDGTITDSWSFSGGRGIFRLGNGNLLATNGTGVHELDAATGAIIETEYAGQARFIELVDLPGVAIGDTPPSVWIQSPGMSVYPNPFHDMLSVSITLPQATQVSLEVYSIEGRMVRELDAGSMGAGHHLLTWDGTSDGGSPLGQGVYFVRMTTPAGVTTMKVNLLR
ncbi:MAG: hypothetical protein AVO35_02235 [Candidatus Aegiribacteria sp. MLS_C]|nr:MAG: hypothetical protein AVO35_02235 [Candidatus Aegiribacteria sp. MLS_C]